MSLHSIFSFHVVMKSGVTPVAQEPETQPARQVISATWRATAEALRASLSDKPGRDGTELEFT